MSDCPVCGADNASEAANCRSCHLSTAMFDTVREAAGVGPPDAQYRKAVAEILGAIGYDAKPTPPVAEPPLDRRVRLGGPSRFPPPDRFAVRDLSSPPEPPTPPESLSSPAGRTLPVLPAAGDGNGLAGLRRQVEELLQAGRREGLDLTQLERTLGAAAQSEDRTALEQTRRQLFVQVSASLARATETLTARRNELAALTPTVSLDTELGSARAALSVGDLTGAQRRLRRVADGAEALEERWATARILLGHAEVMVASLRELGIDPTPALGPIEEGRKAAHQGETARAELVLAGADSALWALLAPSLTRDLARIRDRLSQEEATHAPGVAPLLENLRELADLIRHRNFGAAVGAYHRLREAVGSLTSNGPARTPALLRAGVLPQV